MKSKILVLISIISCVFSIKAQDFEVSPVDLKFTAEPGQTQSIPISITNHANKNAAFNVILADFIVNKEGTKVTMPPATTEHSLVNWLSINPPFLELSPNETRQVIVSIQAPVGDYSTKWAHIFIRSTNEQTALIADKSTQTGLNVLGQIVLTAYQSPKSNMNYKMKIAALSEVSTLTDTLRRFNAKIDNMGDKITNCKVSLLASNLSNADETLLQVLEFSSFPDSQKEVYFEFKKNALPPGKYALAAILDYGKQSTLEGSQILIDVE
ncbi:MAG: hypothetical protein P1P88_16975 [Bacteroidales bacterium]|nr:hypothetical protein [Bacteroidales bacterium]